MRAEADGWTGDLAMAEAAAQAADAALADRGRELAVAEADLQRAEGALRQAEVGRGDAAATLDRLDAAGFPAVGLLDSVELYFVSGRRGSNRCCGPTATLSSLSPPMRTPPLRRSPVRPGR